MASIELHDSRRLTGPNLVADGPGAVIDGRLDGLEPMRFRDAWRTRVREALDAVGWPGATPAERVYRGGLTVFHSAPVDALYAATEVNEWAWAAAASDVGAGDDPEPIGQARDRLRALIDEVGTVDNVDKGDAAAHLMKSAGGKADCKGRHLYHPLRVALTGLSEGFELKRLLPLLGKDRILRRAEYALGILKES